MSVCVQRDEKKSLACRGKKKKTCLESYLPSDSKLWQRASPGKPNSYMLKKWTNIAAKNDILQKEKKKIPVKDEPGTI